jgi:hypothetical protein
MTNPEPEIIDTIYHHLKTIKTNPLITIKKYQLTNKASYIDISIDYQRDPHNSHRKYYNIAHIGDYITTLDYNTIQTIFIEWTDPQLIQKLEQTITQWNQDTDITTSIQRITQINAVKIKNTKNMF